MTFEYATENPQSIFSSASKINNVQKTTRHDRPSSYFANEINQCRPCALQQKATRMTNPLSRSLFAHVQRGLGIGNNYFDIAGGRSLQQIQFCPDSPVITMFPLHWWEMMLNFSL